MRRRDLVDLLLLSAIWGGSFPFMRIAVPEFRPLPLMALRVAIASLFLLPILFWQKRAGALRDHAGTLLVAGLLNSALPFCLLAFATLTLTAGYAALLNATAPLFVALVGYFWLRSRLTTVQAAGLAVGFAGVVMLVWGRLAIAADGTAVLFAVLAGLGATLSYGVAANHAKRYMGGIDSIVSATGSQLAATIALLPIAVLFWPEAPVSLHAWLSVIVLGVLCTGVAYILYFRLITNVGPSKAITVTFLVPLFAMVWGALLLDEQVTASMLLAAVVILAGTSLSTGVAAMLLQRARPS